MDSEQYITFQKFNDLALANELASLLKQNNIAFEFENASPGFDPFFANNEITKEYRIKLQKINFEKADELLQEVSKKQIESIGTDHYLFGFPDNELIEIVTKPDEWSKLDYLLALKILKDRGIEINTVVVDTLRKQRIQELGKPDEYQRIWIIVGYISAVLGGLLGIFIGWHLSSHKKTLPNGDRVYAYSASDRDSGTHIFYIGIFFFIAWVSYRIWAYKS